MLWPVDTQRLSGGRTGGLLSSLGRLAIQWFLRDAASVKPPATATALIRSCSPQIRNPPLDQPIPYRGMDFSAPAVRASLIVGTEMSRHSNLPLKKNRSFFR